jgi:PAS domain S-box-containing protein
MRRKERLKPQVDVANRIKGLSQENNKALSTNSEPVKILHFEDKLSDADEIISLLNEDSLDFVSEVVETKEAFFKAIKEFEPHLILCDYYLESGDSIQVLKQLIKSGIDIPFIILTGEISEAFALEAIKFGADDYVLRERPYRLAIAIKSILEKKKLDNERVKALHKAFEKKVSLQVMIDSTSAVIYSIDKDFRYITLNQTLKNSLKLIYGIEPVPGDSALENLKWMGKKEINEWKKRYEKGFKGKTVNFKEEYNFHGHISIWEYVLSPIKVNNKVIALSCIGVDISESKESEKKYTEISEQYNQLVEHLPEAVYACDISGKIIMYNKAALNLWGRAPDEKKDRYFIWDGVENKSEFDTIEKAIKAKKSVKGKDIVLKKKDGSFSYIIPHSVPSFDTDGEVNGVITIIIDNTDRKHNEEALRISKERFEHVIRATSEAVWEWDIEANIFFKGKGFETLFGYQDKVDDWNNADWHKRIHPDDQQEIGNKINQLIQSKDDYWLGEYRYEKYNGEYAYVQDKAIVIRDAAGNAKRVIGSMRDVTERILREKQLKEINEALEKKAVELSLSNEELERFAYVVSHDLQEPLRMVTAFMSLLKKKYENVLDDKGREYIHYAVDGGVRMRKIILDLLEYSKLSKLESENKEVDVIKVIENVLLLNRKVINESNAKIDYENIPKIFTSGIALQHIFQNLISNAIKYRKKNVKPLIQIKFSDSKTHWKFSVSDNGIGIKKEFSDKIFVIFQRLQTDAKLSGTGIGLSICKKIVENHGGEIWVESEEGKGSVFHFTLKK